MNGLRHKNKIYFIYPKGDTKERVSGIFPLSRTHLLIIPITITDTDLYDSNKKVHG
jgi:hypothetical protein